MFTLTATGIQRLSDLNMFAWGKNFNKIFYSCFNKINCQYELKKANPHQKQKPIQIVKQKPIYQEV